MRFLSLATLFGLSYFFFAVGILQAEEAGAGAHANANANASASARLDTNADVIDKIYLDTISFKLGAASNSYGENDTNGGVASLQSPEKSGSGFSFSASFNNEYLPALKPFIEYLRYDFDDRMFTSYNLGARHERALGEDDSLKWFLGGSVGRMYSQWDKNPAPGNATGVSGDQSMTGGLQTGIDWFFRPAWALDFTVRYDVYDLDTTVVQNSQVTTINDSSSLGAFVGISYKFGTRPRDTRDYNDDDADSVPNYLDQCPGTYLNVPVGSDGCPQDTFLFNLSFQFAEFSIDNLVNSPTFNVVAFLDKHPDYRVHINGFTDSTGADDINEELAFLRARSAADYLIEKGISTKRITYEGKGKRFALTDNDTKESREKNRRIEVIFYKAASKLTQGRTQEQSANISEQAQ
jgi:outer membrane protein OmpA-like peptidoglycan-associated protein